MAASEAGKLNRAKEATMAKLRITNQRKAETDQARDDLRRVPSPSPLPLLLLCLTCPGVSCVWLLRQAPSCCGMYRWMHTLRWAKAC